MRRIDTDEGGVDGCAGGRVEFADPVVLNHKEVVVDVQRYRSGCAIGSCTPMKEESIIAPELALYCPTVKLL